MVRTRVMRAADIWLKLPLTVCSILLLAILAAGCQVTQPAINPAPAETAAGSTNSQVGPTDSPDLVESAPMIENATPVAAGVANAAVRHVRALLSDQGSWTFHVTVEHPDTGWDDYADGWDVVLPDGTVVKPSADSPFTRLLLHPHENEQPFVRSQSGIIIPDGVHQVTVRAHDLVDGFGGTEVVVDLTRSSGPGFELER